MDRSAASSNDGVAALARWPGADPGLSPVSSVHLRAPRPRPVRLLLQHDSPPQLQRVSPRLRMLAEVPHVRYDARLRK